METMIYKPFNFKKAIAFCFCFLLAISYSIGQAISDAILKSEFVYDTAPFPECHASTIEQTPNGMVAAWFGGTKEKNIDVEIWFSQKHGDTWSTPVAIANGIQADGSRHPCWNPVLYQVPGGELILFFKVGPNPREWWGEMKTSADHGNSWSESSKLPEGMIGPVKNKPVMLSDGNLLCPSSSEHDGWRVHFEHTADNGKTWHSTTAINDGKTYNAIQPSVLFHPDHQLQILCRSKEGVLLTSWSAGQRWFLV